jgi:hypothetical protein
VKERNIGPLDYPQSRLGSITEEFAEEIRKLQNAYQKGFGPQKGEEIRNKKVANGSQNPQ